MLPLTADRRVVRSPDLIATEMDGDIVMMHVSSGQYFGISGVGPRIWALLERPMTVEQMTNTIVSEYRVDEQTCRGDILIFVQALLDQGAAQII
ncbi:MAG TPA: PqqD family peptide modification chaperone [Pseudomonas sp.]